MHSQHPSTAERRGRQQPPPPRAALPRAKTVVAIAVLMALLFSKNVYTASLSSYYTRST